MAPSRSPEGPLSSALLRWCAYAPGTAAYEALASLLEIFETGVAAQHSCLPLEQAPRAPQGIVWAELLQHSGLLGPKGSAAPLVLRENALYLAKDARYESALAAALLSRAARPAPVAVAPGQLRAWLEVLFGAPSEAIDWQRLGAAMLLERSLLVLTGGPGTGKTSTVTRALTLLAAALAADEEGGAGGPVRIALAAPTGKAAARLAQAVAGAKASLTAMALPPALAAGLAAIPDEAVTLHRLLGYQPYGNRFARGAEAPLTADVVLVDEASMVDLRLMAQLFAALAPETRVVLLGDKDQLASVETGQVLGDLTAGVRKPAFSSARCRALEALTGDDLGPYEQATVPPLADCLCHLQRSYRFDPTGAVARFAAAVNEGRREEAWAVLRRGDHALRYAETPEAVLAEALGAYLTLWKREREGLEDGALLTALGAFALLTPTRTGPLGVSGLNAQIAAGLRKAGVPVPPEGPFPGMPLMVLRNDPSLGVFNGDLGIVRATEAGLVAVFPGAAGAPKRVLLDRLPAFEPAYACTIHKSQGSEFEEVAVVLPSELGEGGQQLLNRALLYTAVTRAQKCVRLFAAPAGVACCLAQAPLRRSGLGQRLWSGAP